MAKQSVFHTDNRSSILRRDTKFWGHQRAGAIFCKEGREGSIPSDSTNGVWGNGCPLGLGPSPSKFDSCHSDHADEVDQVRHLLAKQKTASSILAIRSNGHMAKR